MLYVLPFCQKDRHLAEQLAAWIHDLGGVSDHECMLVVPQGVSPDGIREPLQRAFKKVYILPITDKDPGKWPEGPNLMLRRVARQIEATSPQPWIWGEPDAIPIACTWLDEIAAAYAATDPKLPFMGARVQHEKIPVHMSGVAVYPGNAPTLAPLLVTCNHVAFDVNAQSQVLPRLTETALIQHEWHPATFASTADLDRLRPAAVIYHQCKDGSLIARLREAYGTTPPLPALDAAPAPVVPVGNPVPQIDPRGVLAAPLTVEEQIEYHVAHLKKIVETHGVNAKRTICMYLSAAQLIPTSPMADPKKKKKPAAIRRAPVDTSKPMPLNPPTQ